MFLDINYEIEEMDMYLKYLNEELEDYMEMVALGNGDYYFDSNGEIVIDN